MASLFILVPIWRAVDSDAVTYYSPSLERRGQGWLMKVGPGVVDKEGLGVVDKEGLGVVDEGGARGG